MKKLIILALMVLLVAGGAFAQVTFGGFIEYETSSSLDTQDEDQEVTKGYGRYDGDIRLTGNVKFDDYSQGTIRVRKAGDAERNNLWIDNAFVVTDFAKFFGLQNMAWKSTLGMNDYGFAPVGNQKWDTLHRVIQRPSNYDGTNNGANFRAGANNDYYFDAKLWGLKESFVFNDVFTLNAFFSLNGNKNGDGVSSGPGPSDNGYAVLRDFYIDAIYAQAAGPGKLSVEVAYMLWTNLGVAQANDFAIRHWNDYSTGNFGFGDGVMLFALGYTGVKLNDQLSLDAGAAYYMAMSEATQSAWAVNAQLNINAGVPAYLLVGAQGYPDAKSDSGWEDPVTTGDDAGKSLGYYDGEILHNLRFAAGVTPIPQLSLDLGLMFYLGDDQIKDSDWQLEERSVLNTLDVSAAVKVGNATYRLGYIYVPENEYAIDTFGGGDNNVDTNVKALYFKAMFAL